MNRREFLELLGVGTTGIALAPSRAVAQTPAAKDGAVVTYHALQRYGEAAHRVGSLRVAPLVLPAPVGSRCRAVIYPAAGLEDGHPVTPNKDEDLYAYLQGVRTQNGIAEVVLQRVRLQDGHDMFPAEVDACVFNTYEHAACPVDWGACSQAQPLVIDYRAFDHAREETLYLALYYVYGDRSGPARTPCHAPSLGGTPFDPLVDFPAGKIGEGGE